MAGGELLDAAVLVRAVEALDSVAIAKLLKAHPTLIKDARSEIYHTLLEVALHEIVALATVSGKAVAVVKTLLHHKPDVNASLDGRSPLHLACFAKSIEIVKLLLDAKANVNATFNGATPLHIAAQLGAIEIVRLLTEKDGIDVNAADMHGLTPLHYAVATANKEIIHILLTSRADVDAADLNGLTSLAAAIYAQRADLVQTLLMHGANVNQTCGGLSPIDFALHVCTEKAQDDASSSSFTTDYDQIRSVIAVAPDMQALQLAPNREDNPNNPNLGSGRFGTCQRRANPSDGTIEVVKTLFGTSRTFGNELCALMTCASEYIVQIRSVAPLANGQWQLVLEYMDNGTLRGHLHRLTHSSNATEPDEINILKVARAIARGLQALHEPKRPHGQKMWQLVHGNLKLDNVLVNKKGEIKLADFGLCLIGGMTMTHVNLLTEHYVAPEVFNHGAKLSTSADIYAFGVILAEVDMRAPAPRGSDEKARQGQYVPEMRSDCAEWYRDLVQWCVAKDPNDRPKIDEVIEILDNPSMETINAVKVAREQKNIAQAELQAKSPFPLKS